MRLLLALAFAFLTVSAASAAAQTSKYGIPSSHVPYAGAIQLPGSTVAQLPACDTYNFGILRAVTDATTPTFNATAVGGGAVKALVVCNGTTWVTP
jgi:ABC-type amino acid transport substrate-binding protein